MFPNHFATTITFLILSLSLTDFCSEYHSVYFRTKTLQNSSSSCFFLTEPMNFTEFPDASPKLYLIL